MLERVIAIEARTRIDDLRQGTLDDVARASAGAAALRLRDQLADHRAPARRRRVELATSSTRCRGSSWWSSTRSSRCCPGRATARGRDGDGDPEPQTLALDRDVAILATAPLPQLAARPDRRPTLDDFGALGPSSSAPTSCSACSAQDMYEPSRDIEGATELLVRKNRNGPTGYVDLYFYAQWMRFEDMLDPDR